MSHVLVPRLTAHSNSAETISPVAIARQELERSPHGEHRSIRVGERNGVIRLEGLVSTFYAKQLAQILVIRRGLAGRIENAIEVA